MLKEAKLYFEQLFKDEWSDTKIHYSGEEFDNTDIDSWINISLEPVRNSSNGIGAAREHIFTFYVVCWGETEAEVMELGDNIAEFMNTNIDTTTYITNGYEIIDREWHNTNKVFMVMAFRFKTYSGTCIDTSSSSSLIQYYVPLTYTFSDNSSLTNTGTSGSTYNALLYSGRAVQLGVANTLTLGDAAKWTMWFDFSDKSFHKVFGVKIFSNITVNNILVTEDEPSDADVLTFTSNPNLVAKLYENPTGIANVSLVLNPDDAWYACSEPTLSTIYNARGVDTHTITNYVETIRSAVDYNEFGLQLTCLILNSLGVPTAYVENKLDWHGNGHGDIQFMPPSDSAWELDFVLYCKADTTDKYNGIFSTSSNSHLYIAQTSADVLTVKVGNSSINLGTPNDGFHHVRVIFDGAGNGSVALDNVERDTYDTSSYTYSASESFFIGALSRLGNYFGYDVTQSTGYLQYVNDERTVAQRTADYNKARGMHPTLP